MQIKHTKYAICNPFRLIATRKTTTKIIMAEGYDSI